MSLVTLSNVNTSILFEVNVGLSQTNYGIWKTVSLQLIQYIIWGPSYMRPSSLGGRVMH